ncbi:hypothetical protein EHS13_13505 [Paenibacillus psychroresistens]|uniref:Type I restriction modification DNA specificity domain-containing protein n=1 Tax=Paenibacillus psychroresistens TaxID=1778678 RepID=A0A6B8RIB9_9BACL|nr:restriction endonuclease subunit S [Paenibacillus psychroresistens]QGQ95819.1 hypothetical protein EHS13_13505 [Paenibacillus psychroresistens]
MRIGMNINASLEKTMVADADQPYDIPNNWFWVKLGTIVEINPSRNIPSDIIDSTETSFVPMASVDELKGEIVVHDVRKYVEIKKGYTAFNEDDILFAKITPCMENGKAAIAKKLLNGFGFGSTEFHVIRSKRIVNKNFVFLLIRSGRFRKQAKGVMSGAVGQQRVPKGFLLDYPFPLPPLLEQIRIVERVEFLIGKIDQARQFIDEVNEKKNSTMNELYTSASLGEISVQWRNENSKKNKNPFIAETIQYSGVVKNKGGFKKNELIKSDLFDKLPEGWAVVSIDEIAANKKNAIKAGPFGSALKKEFHVQNGEYKIYGQEQVIKSDITYGDYFITKEKFLELKSFEISKGDILISLVGTIGKILVVPENFEKGIINPRLVKLSFNEFINPYYIAIYFQSTIAQALLSNSSHGGTMEILNLSIIRRLPIPLPSLDEQNEIVRIVDVTVQKFKKVNHNVDLEKEMNILRESVLSKAFRGELGTNDPEEESALELLKEILQKETTPV